MEWIQLSNDFQRYCITETKDMTFDIRMYSTNKNYMYIAHGDKYKDYFLAIRKIRFSEGDENDNGFIEETGGFSIVIDGVDII